MPNSLEKPLVLVGRMLLTLIFVMSGVGEIFAFNDTTSQMASKGMVATPFFLVGAIAFDIVGGLSVLVGFKARLGALLLIVFLVPATLIFHNFWTLEGQQWQMEMSNFMKNLALIGALLLIVAGTRANEHRRSLAAEHMSDPATCGPMANLR